MCLSLWKCPSLTHLHVETRTARRREGRGDPGLALDRGRTQTHLGHKHWAVASKNPLIVSGPVLNKKHPLIPALLLSLPRQTSLFLSLWRPSALGQVSLHSEAQLSQPFWNKRISRFSCSPPPLQCIVSEQWRRKGWQRGLKLCLC